MASTVLSHACDLRVGDRFAHRSTLSGQRSVRTFLCEVVEEPVLRRRDGVSLATTLCRTTDPETGQVYEGAVSLPVYEWIELQPAY
ncbi:hypothetical protein MAUB_58800 [Mycolicibacterium aubagnense]|uniref:Uncharacterized protein n=1 Tax=Mycolicibacterium aubagnense TaxID=319707 RepID=A0ABM7IMT9_9MYCO|nr:hypothetical protein MAUB_58800 [Mycolicibacterium aubagnense]